MAEIQAVDVHGHYGRCQREGQDLNNEWMTASAKEVVDRARLARTAVTIVSPLSALFPRLKADAVAGNQEALEIVSRTEGLLQYVVLNPLQPQTFKQVEQMLGVGKCIGVKIHPEEHGYPIRKYGREIFEFLATHPSVVLTHSGEQNSLPIDFVPLANQFPQVRLILAHLGHGWDHDPSHQVRAIQASKQGNVYVDTSSAKSVTPNLIEWAVREIGAERILFGTDTPLYFAPMQRARIDYADITDEQKLLILRENAVRLFGECNFISQSAGHSLQGPSAHLLRLLSLPVSGGDRAGSRRTSVVGTAQPRGNST